MIKKIAFRLEEDTYRKLRAALALKGQTLTGWIKQMAEKLIAE